MKVDVVVIGAGHNGLVAAAYLARAGRRVLVLEGRDVLGGAAATDALFPGCRVNVGAPGAALLLPRIASDLDLAAHGYETVESPAVACGLLPGGRSLTVWRDPVRTREELGAWSVRDAERYVDFVEYVDTMAEALASIVDRTPPVPHESSVRDLAAWIRPALKVKGLGRRRMMEFLRVLPMSVRELLDDWFETDLLKGMAATTGVLGAMQGPMASGTAFRMLYHCMGGSSGGVRSVAAVRGGTGRLADALEAAARAAGAEVRTGVPVARVIVSDDTATGVQLADGTEVRAGQVVSGVDPRRTFFELIGARELGPEFNRRVANLRLRGSTAVLHLLLEGPVPVPAGLELAALSGHVVVCPSVPYLERAYDDAKYGRPSGDPALDFAIPTILEPGLAPDGHHIVSVQIRYAPYRLGRGAWDDERTAEALADRVVALLDQHVPGIAGRIRGRKLVSPLDWERDYGLTEGGEYHGQMDLDQLMFMRPVAGWGRYRTPVRSLYLCGAGTHPGGGVTGAPGFNAAREVLRG